MEAINPLIARLQKDINGKDAKIAKQADEIARLKQQIAELKASNSRVRRIPKKPTADAATDAVAEPSSA